uniref:Uncharacterized protein n=1 Tax=Ditylenchus dipsaci TaxID=166011 RepID=A0A915EVB3_9BILA
MIESRSLTVSPDGRPFHDMGLYHQAKRLLQKHQRSLEKVEKPMAILTPLAKDKLVQFVQLMDTHPQNICDPLQQLLIAGDHRSLSPHSALYLSSKFRRFGLKALSSVAMSKSVRTRPLTFTSSYTNHPLLGQLKFPVARVGCPISLLHTEEVQAIVLEENIVNKGQQKLASDLTKLLVADGMGTKNPVCVGAYISDVFYLQELLQKQVEAGTVTVCFMADLPAKRSPVVVFVTGRPMKGSGELFDVTRSNRPVNHVLCHATQENPVPFRIDQVSMEVDPHVDNLQEEQNVPIVQNQENQPSQKCCQSLAIGGSRRQVQCRSSSKSSSCRMLRPVSPVQLNRSQTSSAEPPEIKFQLMPSKSEFSSHASGWMAKQSCSIPTVQCISAIPAEVAQRPRVPSSQFANKPGSGPGNSDHPVIDALLRCSTPVIALSPVKCKALCRADNRYLQSCGSGSSSSLSPVSLLPSNPVELLQWSGILGRLVRLVRFDLFSRAIGHKGAKVHFAPEK